MEVLYGKFAWGIIRRNIFQVWVTKQVSQLCVIKTSISTMCYWNGNLNFVLLKQVSQQFVIKTGISMRESRNFCQGGSRSIWQKKLWQPFFFLVLGLFYRSQEVKCLISKKTIVFQGSGGVQLFQGGYNFFQGGGGGSNCLFPIETHL